MAEEMVKLRLPSTFDSVKAVREQAESSLKERFGLDACSDIDDIGIASTEMMNNAVEHSGAEFFDVQIAFDGSAVVFSLITEGAEFDPTREIKMPDLDGDETHEGGFGIAMVKELSDEMMYEYREGKNVFTIKKIIKGGLR